MTCECLLLRDGADPHPGHLCLASKCFAGWALAAIHPCAPLSTISLSTSVRFASVGRLRPRSACPFLAAILPRWTPIAARVWRCLRTRGPSASLATVPSEIRRPGSCRGDSHGGESTSASICDFQFERSSPSNSHPRRLQAGQRHVRSARRSAGPPGLARCHARAWRNRRLLLSDPVPNPVRRCSAG